MHPLHLLLEWVLYAVSLLIVAHLIPGIKVKSFGSAMIAALIIGLLNVTLGIILHILALPINVITFRIFSGIISLIINSIVIKIAGSFSSDFKVDGFLPAFLAAILIALLQFVWHAIGI